MSDFSLRALRTVVLVERSGSLSRAAVELGIAQSAASRHVAEVEAVLGGPLFHRTGRGVAPTELAADAIPRLRSLLADAEALTLAARERAASPAGLVTLGLVPSLAGPVASALWAEIAQHHPHLQLRVREGYSGEIEAALADGRVDLAIVNRYRARGTNRYRNLFDAPLCAVGRREVLATALAEGGSDTLPTSTRLPMVARLPLVLPLAPNAVRSLLTDEAQHAGLKLSVIMEAGSSVIIKRMLRDHDCATVLPRHAVAEEQAAGILTVVPLAERALRQQMVLATSSQRPFTHSAKAVAQMIPRIVKQLVASMVD